MKARRFNNTIGLDNCNVRQLTSLYGTKVAALNPSTSIPRCLHVSSLVLIAEPRVIIAKHRTLLNGHALHAVVVVTALALSIVPLHPDEEAGRQAEHDRSHGKVEAVEDRVIWCVPGKGTPSGYQ